VPGDLGSFRPAVITRTPTSTCAIVEGRQLTPARLAAGRKPRKSATCPNLRSLAGMRHDLDAVVNGLTFGHNSGAAEGNVTRVKRLKRDGYWRTNFDLLTVQLLLTALPGQGLAVLSHSVICACDSGLRVFRGCPVGTARSGAGGSVADGAGLAGMPR
jgi:hypothetical protein